MMKKFITLLTVFLLSLNTGAQNVSSSEVFDIASKFMAKKGITLVNDDKAATRGNAEPYSIFNGEDGRGFAIVINGAIVGYSTEDTVDGDNLPIQLKDMLDGYSKATTKGTEEFPSEWVARNVTPIEPLIKAKWGQGYPYNDMCPTIDGEHCKTGCVATALAMVIHYFRLSGGCKAVNMSDFIDWSWTVNYKTVRPHTLPKIDSFDYDNMLDEYNANEFTEENVHAVAELMMYCGSVSNQRYGLYTSIGDLPNETIKKYFNFDKVDNGASENLSDEAIAKILDKHLGKKMPILSLGHDMNSNGHMYIIDGRDSEGLYHINWGYSGSGNGYFIVSEKLYKKYGATHNIGSSMNNVWFKIPYATLKATSIDNLTFNRVDDSMVYNLNGQCVGNSLEGLSKGIYIKEGKKHVVK